MEQQSNEELLVTLSAKKEKAFSEEIPDAPLLSEIIEELNSLSQEDKYFFGDFASTLGEELFQKSVNIKGLTVSNFINNYVSNTESVESVAEQIKFIENQTEFNELFKDLVQNLPDHFEILKGYFITKLENNPLESYKLMVLYDSNYFLQPIKKKISGIINDAIFKEIKDYSEEISSGNFVRGNLLCLILLHPRTNNHKSLEELEDFLNNIFSSYKSFESFSLKNNRDSSGTFYESTNSVEDFFEELRYVNGTLLSNGSIRHEEEKIIKKLCSNFKTPLIIYKTLSGGNSGSKVIEVRPKKELGPDHEKRYIIKYGLKSEERKIKKESDSFGKFIEGYKGFNDYQCIYDKTLIYEGLRYSYAISDSESQSYSYSEVISKKNNPFHLNKINIIDDLYSIGLYDTWRDSIEEVECSVKDIYERFIDGDKIFQEIGNILNLNLKDVYLNELYLNFNKIWNHSFKFNQKICHGDLHSENFFIDNKGVYLIDFGYTGIQHAIIDHTSLECSLKFKHLPFYIQQNELNDIEEELILDVSFNLSHRFTKTKRKDLLEMLDVIKKIRSNSISLLQDGNSKVEYLISLFIMTFRQIRYPDMNQFYAYNSALIISRKIVQQLSL
jgi:hypothetical protein